LAQAVASAILRFRRFDLTTTTAAILPPGAARAAENRLVGLVCAAHFVSHYQFMLMAPLFPIIRADLGVSYTELGLTLTLFNIVGAVLQTPAGFLVDRIGARTLLIGALVVSSLAYLLAGAIPALWMLLAMFTVAGVANSIYHPADYAILSNGVAQPRIGRAFSLHNFAGIFGNAVAPPTLLLLERHFGWQGAFAGTAVLGFIVAAAISAYRHSAMQMRPAPKPATTDSGGSGWRLLLSVPILKSLCLFMMLTVVNGGLTTYLVAGLGALHGTAPVTANLALSVSLAVNGAAVLLGGWVAGRTDRHATIAVTALIGTAVMLVLVALYDLPPVLLIAALSFANFCIGVMMPARDMIVRAATPPGEFGKVFGFVTTGFNIGGVFSPMLFGALLDYGAPAGVFLVSAACCLIGILTVVQLPRRAA
jgi:MFS family permease